MVVEAHINEVADSQATRSICPACNAVYDRSVFVCEKCGTGLLEIPDAPLLSGTTLDLRYDIEGVVGTGGMGTVYKARQRGMEREVAVKVLHPRYAHEPRAVKRFFREAQSISRLIHPNVVSVFDFGRSVEGHLYMVMELLEGFTLGDLIHYRAPLPAPLALSILGQICDALEEAHRHRIVHRDLKPDNVLLSAHDEGLWAKVLDFGIARMFREPEDGPGLDRNHSTVEIAGTPAYMSPEQILGKEPDPRSDLYSLGIILFEMLTRQRPFDDESSVTLCMKQLNEEPPRIHAFQPVSEALERLVRGLLAKKPEDRPQRAREVKALIATCPEASFPYTVPELTRTEGPRLGDQTTRAEHIFSPEAGTSALGAGAPGASAAHPRGLALGAGGLGLEPQNPTLSTPFAAPPIERFARETRDSRETRETREAKSTRPQATRAVGFGRSAAELAPEQKKAKRAPVAVACLLVEHPGALATGEVAVWLEAREREGHEVVREDRRATLKSSEPISQLADLAQSLQERALSAHIGVRIGLAEVDPRLGLPMAIDVARRIAAATTHGQVALAHETANRRGIASRPQTTVFLPDGLTLESAVLKKDGDEASSLLWGRGLQLRRLGQIGDEARHSGPTVALVQGARGMGKSSLVQAFAKGRQCVWVRVSPLAGNHPGHTLMQLVAAALGIRPRGEANDLDRLDRLDGLDGLDRLEGLKKDGERTFSDRDRELLELLLLDRQAIEPPSARAWARLVVDVLAMRAASGPLVIVLDDLHGIDRASLEVLQLVIKAADKRPWCFVGTTRSFKPDPLFGDNNRVELRPLGLRAMNQLAEELQVPPRQRHALIAASQGNPASLRLVARLMAHERRGEVPAQVHSLGEGLLAWLLTGLLRAAPPALADRAWCAAALGEGADVEEPLVSAARLYLERELPTGIATWLAERLRREGKNAETLGRSLREGVSPLEEAERRARRTERLGLFRLAAMELEATLPLEGRTQAQRALEVAQLRAQAGDLAGAVSSFEQSARDHGERRPTALLKFARRLIELGDKDRALEALEAAEPAVLTRKDPRLLGEWWVLKSKTLLGRGDLAQAKAGLTRARELAVDLGRNDARGARALMALVQEAIAEVCLIAGDREAAKVNLRQARDAFRDLGQVADSIRCLTALGEVEAGMKEHRRATDTLRAAARLAARSGLVREELYAELALGEAQLAMGEVDEGGQRLRATYKRVTTEDEEGALGARASLGMALAMLSRGLFADALRYAERARKLSRSPGLLARIALVECESHLGEQQPRRAQKSLSEAIEAARHGVSPFVIEQLRSVRGQLPGLDDARP